MTDKERPPKGPIQDDDDESTAERALVTSRLPEPAERTEELLPRDFLVLVVDDSADNLALLSLDLQQQGYRVVTATDGRQAINIASLTSPDLILMDIAMPELDGLGAAHKIRESEKMRNVPIIAITAFSTEGFQRAAHNVGIDGYLTKPINFERLHELMRRLLPIKK